MNKYDQVRVLGQGGFGKAILAKRKSDSQLFVIKEVRLTALSAKDREDALKEVKILSSLHHPYIVDYTESFQERGCLYIVMGYADGGDLAQKIEKAGRKLFSEDEILHDFIEIALAIKYIHDRKFLHRDLKGQNVFLMKDGTVKLGDFGIAKALEHTFQNCKTQIGTPYYLSPEICMGKPYNMKTDIWSLGCILYELCTLKHAFEAPNMNQLLNNIIRGRYTPISSQYSADLKSLIERMLTKEPEKRPTINQILATPFIKDKLNKFLDQTMLNYEMQHTIIHGRKPFQEPTIVPHRQPEPAAPVGGGDGFGNLGVDHSGFTKKREEQQKKMEELQKRQRELDEQVKKRDAELKRKEEEIRKKQEQQRQENAKRDAELKKMEEDLARREKEEKAKFEAKERELQKQRQQLAKAEVDKREAELKRQEELFRQREKDERARLDAKEQQLRQQANINPADNDFDRRAAEIRRKQEELDRRGREERAKLDERERQIQQQKRMYEEQQRKKADDQKRMYEEQQRRKIEDQERRNLQARQQKEAQDREAYERRQRDADDYKRRMEREREEEERQARQRDWEDRNRIANQNRNRDRGGPFAYDNPQKPPQRQNVNNNYNNNNNLYGGINDDDRKRLFFEQQQAAAANRARVRNDGMGAAGCFNYDEPEPRNNNVNRNRNVNNRQADEEQERMRIYMEQRREALANRDKYRNQDMRGNAVMDAIRDPNADLEQERYNKKRNADKQRQAELEEEERRRIFMEQKRAAQANRDRMRQMEMGGGEARDAIMRNDPDDEDDINEQKRRNQKKQNELDDDERRRLFMEQKRAAQANRDRMRQMEMGGGEVKEALFRDDDSDDEKQKNKNNKKKEYDEEAMKEFYRQQRHEARANRERLRQAEYGGADAAPQCDDESSDSSSHHRHRRHRHHHDRSESQSEDDGGPQKKKEMNVDEINAYMREQRHIAAANKARAQAAEAESQFEKDLKENAKDDEPLPQKKKNMSIEEINAYMREQRHIARANKAKAQAAEAESQFEKDLKENAKDDEPLPQKKKDMSIDEINAYMREQRHIARANKAKAQAAEAESQLEKELKENAKDDDPLPQKKKDMSIEEINAYMREQRHIARANKAKAQAAEAESQLEKELKENSKDDEPLPQKKKDMSIEEINAYMREQRHIARANKAKAQAAEAESQLEKELKENAKDDEPLPQKKKDMSIEEINAYMREQRHIARANKAKAQAAEAESQLEKELKENSKDDEPLPQKKKEMSIEEINAYMREQRHIARANRERAERAEFDKPADDNNDDDKDEPPPQKEKKKEMSLEEINAFMREQRHARRAYRAKAEAELHGANMDQLIAEAEAEQRAHPRIDADKPSNEEQPPQEEDDEPPPQKEKKPEMSLAEINAFMREQRHARRANRARAEAELQGVNMDQLIAEAEAEQRAHPKIDADKPSNEEQPPQEEDDEPPPQKEKKPEMSLAEINAFMREQRHARRANRARAEAELQGVNMDQLIAQAEAEQRAHPTVDQPANDESSKEQPPQEEDDEPPPQKEKKPEMSLAEINAFMREQRHARRANKARAEAELQGINMDDLIAQAEAEQRSNPQVDTPPEKKETPAQPKETPEPSANIPPPQKPARDPTKPVRPLPFKAGAPKQQQQSETASSEQPQRMTVAEARRQAMAKKAAQQQPQAAQPSPSVETPSEPQPESVNNDNDSHPQPLLDKAAMRDLFAQQRNELRLNRERIKAAQDGSRDPTLMAKFQSKPSQSVPSNPIRQQPNPVPKVSINRQSANDRSTLKNSARRIIQSDSPRNSPLGGAIGGTSTFSDHSKLANQAPVPNGQQFQPSSNDEEAGDDNNENGGNFDMSQALNSKSASTFLKSRSIVLDTLKSIPSDEDEGDEAIDDLQKDVEELQHLDIEEHKDESQLSQILEQAKLLNDALNLDENEENQQAEESNIQESQNQVDGTSQFYLRDRVINLPAVHDDDSLSYRAEAIRAFLEKELGLDKLIELKQAVADQDPHSVNLRGILNDVEPGVIVLAQQLLILDECVDQAAM